METRGIDSVGQGCRPSGSNNEGSEKVLLPRFFKRYSFQYMRNGALLKIVEIRQNVTALKV